MLDGATSADPMDEEPPRVGDLTVCMYCGTRLRFGLGMALHVTDAADADPEGEALVRHVQAWVRGRHN